MMISDSLLILFVLLLATAVSLYSVIFAIVGDFKLTNAIFRVSLSLSLSKEKREENQIRNTEFRNLCYKKNAEKIVKLSDKEIASDIGITIDEAKQFKKHLSDVLKKEDYQFVDISDVKKQDKINRTYSFMKIVIKLTERLSDPREQFFIEQTNRLLNKNIGQEKFEDELRKAARDENYAKLKLKEIRQKQRLNFNINEQSFKKTFDAVSENSKDSDFINSNIDWKFLYKKMGMQ